jgi:hypothetical protein
MLGAADGGAPGRLVPKFGIEDRPDRVRPVTVAKFEPRKTAPVVVLLV